MMFSAASCCSE